MSEGIGKVANAKNQPTMGRESRDLLFSQRMCSAKDTQIKDT